MASTRFEYREGERRIVPLKLDKDAADLTPGMAVTESGATSGYVKEVDAVAEAVIGIVVDRQLEAGTTDGDKSVLVDVSEESIYEVPPDSGTATQTMVNKTMDVGANAKSVDINGSTTDDIEVLRVDTVANTLFVRLRRTLSGV